MLKLLVYKAAGKHYIVLLGGSQGFKTKEDVFLGGNEEEIFEVSQKPGVPLLEAVREVIAEADRRGIKDIKCIEEIFASRVGLAIPQPSTPTH